MAKMRLPFSIGRACEICGDEATGMDHVGRRFIATCDRCHEEIRAQQEQDEEIDSRDEEACEVEL